MKKILPFIAIIIILPLFISQKPPRNGDKPYVEGQIMVKLRSDASREQQEQDFSEFLAEFSHLDLRMEQRLSERLNIVLLNFNPGRISDQKVLDEIRSYPEVEMAQFNHFVEQRELIPSDSYFGLQWNMHNTGQTGGTDDADIDAPEAWELGTSGFTATGDEIVIAIVDDGFDLDHEDLEFWKNVLEIPGNGIDDDTNGYIDDYDGWNSWSNSGVLIERDHGTHVTGIAAAQGDNDKGVTGVNWNMRVLPVVGSGTVESIVVASYAYLYEMRARYNESNGEKGAFIVSNNASFGVNMGQPEDYPIWGAMYDSLGALGILSVGATANANWNIDEVGDIPTAFPSDWLITVTNTNEDDGKNTGAGYGATTIDLGAPGTSVYSTRQNGAYGYKTGTSMSAPHVSGAIAYLFSIANEAFMDAYHDDPAGMALILKQYILDGADPLPSLEGITVTGGRLNIYNSALYFGYAFLSISASREYICQGESSQLTSTIIGGNGEFTYSWTSSPAGFTSNEPNVTVSPEITTTYFLEVTNETMTLNDQIVIQVGTPTTFTLGADTSICEGESIIFSPGPGFSEYLWNTGATTASISATTPGTYWVEVTNIYGCTSSDTVNLLVGMPGQPVIESGPATVDNFQTASSVYTCTSAENAMTYLWTVVPVNAGTFSGNGTSGQIVWSNSFSGTAIITVAAVNDCGTGETSADFTTTVYTSAGLDEIVKDTWFTTSPNPAREVLRVEVFGLSAGNVYLLDIHNIAGENLKTLPLPVGQNQYTLDLGELSPGIYFLTLREGSRQISTKKFIKSN